MTDESTKRRAPTRDERQATAYLMITRGDGTPIIDREEAKTMTAKEIVAEFEKRVQWHHEFEHALGGGMHPTMLTPLAPDEHKKIPSKARVEKAKRITKAQAAFQQRLLAKANGEKPPPRKTKKGYAPMPGGRGSKVKRTMLGKVVPRD